MSDYSAVHIQVLEGLEAVRKRPGMYVGSTDERGLHVLLHEVLEPAADAVLHGRASTVEVTLLADGGVRIAHDGSHGGDLAERLTRPWVAAGPVGSRISLSWFSVGLGVVNALTERLLVEERRAGATIRHEYARGRQLTPPTEVGPAGETATVITFRPDPEVFSTTRFSYSALADRFRELAFLNRDLDLVLIDERRSAPRTERFRSPGGTADFTAFLGGDPSDTVLVERTDERMGGALEVAVSWSGGGGLHCFANSRRSSDGSHLSGLRDGLRAALLPLTGRRALRTVLAGLTAVVSVKLDAPDYEGCTRERLGNLPVRACVAEAVQQAVAAWLAEHPRRAAELRAL